MFILPLPPKCAGENEALPVCPKAKEPAHLPPKKREPYKFILGLILHHGVWQIRQKKKENSSKRFNAT